MSENNYHQLPKHTKQILMNAINLRLREIQQFEASQRADQVHQESVKESEKTHGEIERKDIQDDMHYLIY